MTKNQRGPGVLTVLVVLAAATVAGLGVSPAAAATTDACKVLKRSEIRAAFGGSVDPGKQGLRTPVSSQCQYRVSADGDRPEGTVIVHLTTKGGQAAYDGLRKRSNTYEPIDGVPQALSAQKLHVVKLLKGKVLLGVQGTFVATDPLPIHFSDVQAQLTALAQQGAARV
jgi:hypothetical protein